MRTIIYRAQMLPNGEGCRLFAINMVTNDRGSLTFQNREELELFTEQNGITLLPTQWINQ